MSFTKEEKNKEEVSAFLANNSISPQNAMGYNKFETTYYVGNSRIFREETPIIFNIVNASDIHVLLPEINGIEFESELNIREQNFHFNEEDETLTIMSDDSTKHNESYRIVISSIYLDFT